MSQASLFTTGAGGQSPGDGVPKISFIIVHYRTPDLLRACLASIASSAASLPHEVLVIDNAPLDEEAQRISSEHPRAIYRRNEQNLGFGRAVNQGLAAGRGDCFLVLNPDVEVRPGSVEALLDRMGRDPTIGIAAPKLLNPDGSLQHSCRTFYTLPVFLLRRTFLGRLWPNHRILREHLMLDYDHEETREVDWCLGASLLVRRRAVEDVGPMDERFFLYFEDVDWCYRMRARGWKTVYHPASIMVHRYGRESARRPGKGLLIHLASTFRYYEKWSFVLYWLKRRSSTIRKMILVLSDFAAVNLAFASAYLARHLSGAIFEKPMFGVGRYARLLVFTNAVALVALALAGMYRSRRREEGGEQLLGAARAIAATALIMMASTFLFATPVYSRAVVIVFLPLALLYILLFRAAIFRAQGSVRSRRLHLRRIGLLAPPADAEEMRRRLDRDPHLGWEILPLTNTAAVLAVPRGGEPASIEEATLLWVQDERIAEVVIFEDWSEAAPAALIERLTGAGIPVRLVPRLRASLRHGARMGDFLGMPALQVSGFRLAGRSWEKRILDTAAALTALALFLVPFLLARGGAALLGRGTLRRELIGRNGKRLCVSALAGRWPGGFLLTAVREYPTLLLWLRGEWSMVGIHPFEAAAWDALPEAYRRFPPDAPPGWITLAGPAARTTEERCAANLEYVGRWSLALDGSLLLDRLRRRKGER